MSAIKLLFPLLFAAALASPAAAPVSLFDGKSLAGWASLDGGKPGDGWEVVNGTIHRKAKGGDLYLDREIGDFDLSFEFKVSKTGNSGVKYRLAKYGKDELGPEYQILDDELHPDSLRGKTHRTGALYDLKAAADDKPYKPAGEWNSGRIVARGTHLEHWLNGVKVMEIDTDTPEWRDLKAKSKFKARDGFGENTRGRLHLQDHGDEVWFRNLMLTEP